MSQVLLYHVKRESVKILHRQLRQLRHYQGISAGAYWFIWFWRHRKKQINTIAISVPTLPIWVTHYNFRGGYHENYVLPLASTCTRVLYWMFNLRADRHVLLSASSVELHSNSVDPFFRPLSYFWPVPFSYGKKNKNISHVWPVHGKQRKLLSHEAISFTVIHKPQHRTLVVYYVLKSVSLVPARVSVLTLI